MIIALIFLVLASNISNMGKASRNVPNLSGRPALVTRTTPYSGLQFSMLKRLIQSPVVLCVSRGRVELHTDHSSGHLMHITCPIDSYTPHVYARSFGSSLLLVYLTLNQRPSLTR